MIRLLKKIMTFVITGSVSVILAACYGVPVDEMYYKMVKTADNEGNPIKGLRVVLRENQQGVDTFTTDEYGQIQFELLDYTADYSVIIEDIDGEENGGEFKTKEIEISKDHFYDITLEKKEN